MTTQKKNDLKDQYQVADLREYDVMHTCLTAYPSRRVLTGNSGVKKYIIKGKLSPLHLPL